MRTRLCLAEERRPARRAESPVHLVATVRDTWIVAGLPVNVNAAVRKQALTVPLPAPIYWHSLHQHMRVTTGGAELSQRIAPQRHRPVIVIACSRQQGEALIADPTSESTGPAITQASTSLYVPTGDVTPNHAFKRTRRYEASAWRSPVAAGRLTWSC